MTTQTKTWQKNNLSPSKTTVVSWNKNLYPHCSVLVGYRNGFELDYTIELNLIEGLVED